MSRFSHDDYTRAMLNLLPSGIAWNRLPDSVQYRLMRGLAQAYRQSDADACALITGAFPETADALIDEWY
ncbi:phage tail protein, partial [Escherichia coli]|nr:phage tail protein [Escherichia coli]